MDVLRQSGRHRRRRRLGDPGRRVDLRHQRPDRRHRPRGSPGPVRPGHPGDLPLRAAHRRAPAGALAAINSDPFSATFVSRGHPAAGRADSTLMVFRSRYVGQGMREDLRIRNFGAEPTAMPGGGVRRRRLRRPVRGEGGPGRGGPGLRDHPDGGGRLPGDLLPAGVEQPGGATPVHRLDGCRRSRAGARGRGGRVLRPPGRGRFRAGVGLPDLRGPRIRARWWCRRAGRWSACMEVVPVIESIPRPAPVPLRPAGGAGRALGAPGPVAPAGSPRQDRPPGTGGRGRPQRRGPGGPAHLRPRLPRAGGGGGRRALVHDGLRPGLAADRLVGPPGRSRPGPRGAPDAGPVPGHRRWTHSTRSSPAGSCTRCASAKRPRSHSEAGASTTARPTPRRSSSCSWASSAAGASVAGAGRRAPAQRRPGAGLDRGLRRRRRRRLRRVPPGHRPGAGQPGVEGQLGRYPLRRRPRRRGPHRPLRGAGLRLRRLPGPRPLRLRGGGHGALRSLPQEGDRPEGRLQPRLLARGQGVVRRRAERRQEADRLAHLEHRPLPVDRDRGGGEGRRPWPGTC